MTTKPTTTTNPIALYWRNHTNGLNPPKRVWRSDWPADTFEVLTFREFEMLESFCRIFSIPLTEAED